MQWMAGEDELMPTYRIHSPWLSGEEANGIRLLPSAIDKLRASVLGRPVAVGDGRQRINESDVVGWVQLFKGIPEFETVPVVLIICNRCGSPLPVMNNCIRCHNPLDDPLVNLRPVFCIEVRVCEQDSEDANVLQDNILDGEFIRVRHVLLIDSADCAGRLERID
jgi:hypothetical protein